MYKITPNALNIIIPIIYQLSTSQPYYPSINSGDKYNGDPPQGPVN